MARAFDARPVISHPMFLVSFIVVTAGWFSAFIGQAVTEAKFHSAGGSGSAVGVPWFGIFLQLFVDMGLFQALATDSLASSRFQLSIFLAVALVFAVLGVNTGIFTSSSYQLAIGAGWLIVAIVDICWLLFLTAEEDSVYVHLFNSGASQSYSPTRGSHLHGANRAGVGMSSQANNSGGLGYTAAGGYAGVGGKSAMGPAGMSVGELSGGHGGHDDSGIMGGGGPGSGGGGNQRSPTIAAQSIMSQGPEYTLKAKALYSYSASPDDPNEISFTKGDLLLIVDNSGKWWQAQKADGTKGIVPSNYVTML